MKFIVRRIVLGVGAALVLGGWGLTQFASEQHQAASGSKPAAWWGEIALDRSGTPAVTDDESRHAGLQQKLDWATTGGVPAKTLFLLGVVAMGLGGGLVGWTLPRPLGSEYDDEELPGGPGAMRIS